MLQLIVQQNEKHLQMISLCILSCFGFSKFLMQSPTVSGLYPVVAMKLDTISHDVWVYVQAGGLWMAYVQTEHRKTCGDVSRLIFKKTKGISERFWNLQYQEHTKEIAVNMYDKHHSLVANYVS